MCDGAGAGALFEVLSSYLFNLINEFFFLAGLGFELRASR
jgi:hypothetical protein